LAAVHSILLEPKNAVYQGLKGRVNVDQGQRPSLDFHLNSEVCRRLCLDPQKGPKELIPPWQTIIPANKAEMPFFEDENKNLPVADFYFGIEKLFASVVVISHLLIHICLTLRS